MCFLTEAATSCRQNAARLYLLLRKEAIYTAGAIGFGSHEKSNLRFLMLRDAYGTANLAMLYFSVVLTETNKNTVDRVLGTASTKLQMKY